MKKIILITLITTILIMLGIQSVSAIDLNLINSVRENEITSSENLSLNTNTSEEFLDEDEYWEDENDIFFEDEFDNSIEDTDITNTSTVISNVTTPQDGTLTIGNILNILLVVVGVLLILLGIAIMIRMNR